MATKKSRRRKVRLNNPILVSQAQFARESGLGYSLTKELVASGQIPSRLIGSRRWVIRDSGIDYLRKDVA